MLSKNNLILALIIGAALALAAYLGFTYPSQQAARSSGSYEDVLKELSTCSGSLEIIECARPYIPKLLGQRPVSEIIDDVNAMQLPANQCHYVVHVLGSELYKQTNDLEGSLAQCSRVCNSACPHGVIAEAFSEEYGVRDAAEPEHASVDSILEQGRDLCADRNTCHGMGHALLATLDDLDQTLSACTSISSGIPRQDCYRGTYMEFADRTSERSLWPSEGAALPSTAELDSFCDRASADEVAACFYYFPIILRQTYRREGIDESREESLQRLKPICEAQTDAWKRRSCIIGFGVTLYQQLLRDQEGAIRICQGFSGRTDQISCMAGMFSLALEYGRTPRAISYCTQLADTSLRTPCYRAIFEKVDSLLRPIDDAKKFCPDTDATCVEVADAVQAGDTKEFF